MPKQESLPEPVVAKSVRISLRTKVYAGFLVVAFAGMAIGGVLVERSVGEQARTQVEERLAYEATMLGQMTANALFGDIDPSDTSLNETVHALGESVHTQLAVIAKNGVVVADSDSTSPLSEPPQAEEVEILRARARASQSGVAARDGRIYVARAIIRDGNVIGYARSSVPLEVVTARVREVRMRMAYGGAAAVLVAMLLAYLVSSRIVRPVRALSQGARRVGAGDFQHRIAITTRDEIADLSRAFNDMTMSLEENIEKLDGRNRDMRLVLDHVDQGLFTIDLEGEISAEHSAVLDVWFGSLATGTKLWEYLSPVDTRFAEMFRCGWDELLEGVMPPEVVIDQLPARTVIGGRELKFNYTMLFNKGEPSKLSGLLVTVSDITSRIAAERSEGEQRELMAAVERITNDRATFIEFFAESQRLVEQICAPVRPPLPTVRRLLHTFKGNSALYGLGRFAALAHKLEDQMADTGEDLGTESRERLTEQWHGYATRLELVLGDGTSKLEVDDEEYVALYRRVAEGAPHAEIARTLADWKLERIEDRLRRFGTHAVALAQQLEKPELEVEVEVAMTGMRVSREALASFWSAFAHAVRNAIDHGIETGLERETQGKDTVAHLTFRACQVEDTVIIELSDDGRGIDWDAVAAKAKKVGLKSESRDDLVEALFCDGVSTKSEINDVSGRGVGLGTVRAECTKLGGTVTIASQPNRGTTFRFSFPYQALCGLHPDIRDVGWSAGGRGISRSAAHAPARE